MKNLLLLLFVFSGFFVFGQDTCPSEFLLQTTVDDDLIFSEPSGLDCDALGATLTVVAGGETFQYSLDECSGTEATYNLDAGNVMSFVQGDEIVITFGDGSVGTYLADDPNRAFLETCEAPAPNPIPTLSQWGLILLFLLGSIFGIVVLNSRKKLSIS